MINLNIQIYFIFLDQLFGYFSMKGMLYLMKLRFCLLNLLTKIVTNLDALIYGVLIH